MSTKQKITKTLNVQTAESLVKSAQENTYYVFAAKHTPYTSGGSDNSPPVPQDTIRSSVEIYNDMLFGKRIRPDNINTMIKRYSWVENTVYDMYSDTDTDLSTKQFYVVIDETTEYNVYKCLYNNKGAKSTQKPFGKDVASIEFPQDGYIWKYMYTIDQFNIRRFATDEYVPVIPDASVQQAAVPGSIDIIYVNDGGSGYNNYTTGSFPSASAIAIGSGLKYALDNNASNIDQYYKDCLIKITSGAAANEYRIITNYQVVNGQKIIDIEREFNTQPSAGDEYEIYPNVYVYDNSTTSTIGCVARAIVNSSIGNAISRIEVLNAGAGYRLSSASIKTANVVGVLSTASLTPIISPTGGHGSDINSELFANYVCISQSFSGNTAAITSSNDYRTIGILKNPTYANVNILLENNSIIGSFIGGENVYRYRPLRLFGNVNVYSNTLVIGTNTTFTDSLRTDDRVIITNGVSNIFANVAAVIDDTTFRLSVPSTFTSDNCVIYYAVCAPFGKVTQYNTSSLTLTEVNPSGWDISSFVVGEQSFCTAGVANTQPNITSNGRDAEEFNEFNQLTTFIGTVTSSALFVEDETLVQDVDDLNTQPSARIHSYQNNVGSSNDYIFVTNVNNSFSLQNTNGIGGVIRGETSDASFTARYKYNGEIVPNSGEILYIENLNPIARNTRQTENIKIILEC